MWNRPAQFAASQIFRKWCADMHIMLVIHNILYGGSMWYFGQYIELWYFGPSISKLSCLCPTPIKVSVSTKNIKFKQRIWSFFLNMHSSYANPKTISPLQQLCLNDPNVRHHLGLPEMMDLGTTKDARNVVAPVTFSNLTHKQHKISVRNRSPSELVMVSVYSTF